MTNAETNDRAAAVAEQGAHVAPKKSSSKKGTSHKNGAPKAKKRAQAASRRETGKQAAKPKGKTAAPRAESKGAKILEMIGRAEGATLAEIMKATDWQAHSVQGFVSTAAKKHGIKIESSKNDSGDRVYRIAR